MKPLLVLLLGPLLAASANAIVIDGVSNESNYTGDVTFSIDDPSGFTTTATLNGEPIPVGTPVTVDTARFYALIVQETPDGGGATATETLRFVIREPGRGSTETGLPAFRAFPLVNDAPSAIATGQLDIVAPAAYPADLEIPIVARLQKTNGDPLWLNALVTSAAGPQTDIQLRRGFGYTFLPASPGLTSASYDAQTAGLSVQRSIALELAPAWTPAPTTVNADADWGGNARIEVLSDLLIAAGSTLTIGAGTIFRVAPGIDIDVDGTLRIEGTLANPVVFTPESRTAPWGGFLLRAATSRVEASGAIFTGSGADTDWFDTHAGFGAHRDEQALFILGPEGASLDLTECFLIENPGQVLHNDDGADIMLDRCLLQGSETCGELSGGTFTADKCALLMFPDDDPGFADGDNDAIYLTRGTHTLTDTVIGYTQDDGIDTGGSPNDYESTSTVQNCWFESILHEGMSNSGEKNCNAFDSVFFNCGQSMECGYDGPHSTMERCLATANLVGARRGDNYDWSYSGCELTVRDSLLIYNLYHDIWGYDWTSWSYDVSQMTVTGNLMTIPGDLARHPVVPPEAPNALYDPTTDAARIAPFMPVPNSNVGVAITGRPSQGGLDDWDDETAIQLSTFSARPVSVDWTVSAKIDPNDRVPTTLASGTAQFQPGETRKLVATPLPADHPYRLVRLSLSAPVNAEITGTDAWYFELPPTPPDELLIARGSVWSFNAGRVEPANWETNAFDDGAWRSGPTQIGFGDDDEATELTSAEAGPSDDRTITVYFRHEFQLADPASVAALGIDLVRDDGAVVYLNGTEIVRSNMPSGTIDYDTLADDDTNPENNFRQIDIDPRFLALLRPGENLLAVEIHQKELDSSDLSFDLELVASFSPPFSDVSGLTVFGDEWNYYWLDASLVLQTSTDLQIWFDRPAAVSPLTIDSIGVPRQFFRLRQP